MSTFEKYIAAIVAGLLISTVALIEYNRTNEILLEQAVYDCKALYGISVAKISEGKILCKLGERRWLVLEKKD